MEPGKSPTRGSWVRRSRSPHRHLQQTTGRPSTGLSTLNPSNFSGLQQNVLPSLPSPLCSIIPSPIPPLHMLVSYHVFLFVANRGNRRRHTIVRVATNSPNLASHACRLSLPTTTTTPSASTPTHTYTHTLLHHTGLFDGAAQTTTALRRHCCGGCHDGNGDGGCCRTTTGAGSVVGTPWQRANTGGGVPCGRLLASSSVAVLPPTPPAAKRRPRARNRGSSARVRNIASVIPIPLSTHHHAPWRASLNLVGSDRNRMRCRGAYEWRSARRANDPRLRDREEQKTNLPLLLLRLIAAT